MKQKYSSLFFYLKNIRLSKYLKFFISTIFIFLFHSSFGQQVIITGIVDGTLSGGNPKGIELYIDGAVDLSSYQLWRSSNGGSFSNKGTLSGNYSNEFVYLTNNSTNFATVFGSSGDFGNVIVDGDVNGNGDDGFQIRLISNNSVIDQVWEDNTSDQYRDSYMYRNDATGPDGSWISGNWTIPGNDTLDGASAAGIQSTVPFGTYSVTANTTWTGSSGTDWNTSGNWSNGVPTSSYNASIPDVTNAPIISVSTGATVKDLTINESEGLTINSGGSLIVSGTSTGNITYNRNIPTTNWYLVSSPVVGQTIVDFYTNESPVMGSGTGNDQNVAIAPYDNSQSDANDRWDYYTEGEVDGNDGDDTTDTFGTGIGYSVLLQSADDIAFTGTMSTENVDVSISNGTGAGGNEFNLVGNPYPSFIAANNNADATNNILKVNDTDNDFLSESTLWFWDQSTNSYDQINHASLAKHIAPGQGFFVSANGSHTFSITEAMQSHQGTDSFQRLTTRPEIELTLSNGTATRNADIYYLEGTTTGWDNGYDSSIFGGVANEFAIYTHSVANGNGRNLGIQSLPPNNYENMIIPVGINAEAGTAITIDATTNNFPEGINIYLEDKQDNSFTLLEADSNFSFTPENNLDGIGRFYLHTTSGVLSANDFATNTNISIYTSSNDNLRIAGVQNGTATVRLYNILGKEMLKSSFVGSGVNDINLNTIPVGIYIVKLTTENGTLNRKIIIQY